MELEDKYWLSQYQDLGELNGNTNVHIVRNRLSGVIGVKKYVDLEMEEIYQYLKNHSNPYIPVIYNCIKSDEKLIIIEEYLTGKNLEEVQKDHKFEEQEAVEIIIALCNALLPLHNANPPIICRDLKAENIMITQEGNIKVVDFDIARIYQPGKNRDTVIMGTENYAAPEQFGFAQTDARTDIYGMGVLLNYLLTKRFPGEYIFEGNLAGIIQRCIALKPEERYQCVEELKGDLENYIRFYTVKECQSAAKQKAYGVINDKKQKSYALPGFRSKKIWKMCISIIGYLFLVWMCFTTNFTRNGVRLVFPLQLINRVLYWISQMVFVLYVCDYRGFKEKVKLPLVHRKSRGVRILGYVLAWFIFVFVSTMICAVFELIIVC